MKILVCVKQVFDRETHVHVDEMSGWVRTEGPAKYWMSQADEFAVEEAVLIKEAWPDTMIDILTVGPVRASQVLERAIGMGSDHGVHIMVRDEGYLAPLAIASWISAYATDKAYDLVLTGVMAEDDMQGQVGPFVAELLSFPCATSVIFEKIYPERGAVYVEREIEGGLRDALELDLPAVLTVQTGMNRPRYPSLSNLLRAKKQMPLVIDPETLPRPGDREKIEEVAYPVRSRTGQVLQGGQKEKAITLLKILREKALI